VHYLHVLKLKAPTQWVGTTACWMRVVQFGMMCSTYPICYGVGNGSNNGPGTTNTSDSNIPGIFDLDVGDTNWVMTSSFIIFTMQTGDTIITHCYVLQQPAVRCNILKMCKSLLPIFPFTTSRQVALRSILWPRRLLIASAQVRFQVSLCGFHGGQSFLQLLPLLVPYSISFIYQSGMEQWACLLPESQGIQSHTPPYGKKRKSFPLRN
jgi:hypothetical protein